MNLGLSLLGCVPALLAMLYVDRLDAKRPEPRWSLRRVAIAGGVSVIPCIFIELGLKAVGPTTGYAQALFEGFVMAAIVEELAKVLCVRWFVWNRPEFDERLDGIVYATRAGLGFALVENVVYLLGAKTMTAFVSMFLLRAVLAVPSHAIYAGMMGYFAARRRFDGKGPGLAGGYLIAVLLHGTYDAGAFSAAVALKEGDTALAIGFFGIPVAIVVGGGIALRRMARRALAADDAAAALNRVAPQPSVAT